MSNQIVLFEQSQDFAIQDTSTTNPTNIRWSDSASSSRKNPPLKKSYKSCIHMTRKCNRKKSVCGSCDQYNRVCEYHGTIRRFEYSVDNETKFELDLVLPWNISQNIRSESLSDVYRICTQCAMQEKPVDRAIGVEKQQQARETLYKIASKISEFIEQFPFRSDSPPAVEIFELMSHYDQQVTLTSGLEVRFCGMDDTTVLASDGQKMRHTSWDSVLGLAHEVSGGWEAYSTQAIAS